MSGELGYGDGGDTSEGVPIAEALEHLVELRGLGAAVALTAIQAAWNDAVGLGAAQHMRPVTLEGDALVVEVDHPAWATQAQLSSTEVLGRLHEELGEKAPSRLVARVSPRGWSKGPSRGILP